VRQWPKQGEYGGYGTNGPRGAYRTWRWGRGQLSEAGRHAAVKLTSAEAFSSGVQRGRPLEVASRVP
jgi:hypothetical protein